MPKCYHEIGNINQRVFSSPKLRPTGSDGRNGTKADSIGLISFGFGKKEKSKVGFLKKTNFSQQDGMSSYSFFIIRMEKSSSEDSDSLTGVTSDSSDSSDSGGSTSSSGSSSR